MGTRRGFVMAGLGSGLSGMIGHDAAQGKKRRKRDRCEIKPAKLRRMVTRALESGGVDAVIIETNGGGPGNQHGYTPDAFAAELVRLMKEGKIL